jgi:hypothetical protein
MSYEAQIVTLWNRMGYVQEEAAQVQQLTKYYENITNVTNDGKCLE